jgi:hypothetical protein
MRFALMIAPVLVAALALGGCASDVSGEEDVESSESELGQKMSPAELASTKAALRKLSNDNMRRSDNFAQVRTQADPLVAKLARHFGTRTAKQKLPLVTGAWRQLWSDYPYPMNGFNKMDPAQVYQVVTPDGYYYNIGDSTSFFVFGTTGILRGSYAADGSKLRIQFTDVGFRIGRLQRGTNLYNMATSIEANDIGYFGIPGGGEAPNGPINIKGTLETLYVDADLRVERGTQDDFRDEAGQISREGIGPKLFILDRVTVPAK